MRKLSIGFIVTAMLLLSTTVNAQSAAKSIYFELGGPGLASFNYDMRFQKKEDGLGFRVGIGGFKISDESALFLPVALNYLIGKDAKNYFEIGAGLTYVSYKERYLYTEERNTFEETFGHLHFGYRLQPKNGGFLFRAGITPIFNSEGFIPYYASLAFGYKF